MAIPAEKDKKTFLNIDLRKKGGGGNQIRTGFLFEPIKREAIDPLEPTFVASQEEIRVVTVEEDRSSTEELQHRNAHRHLLRRTRIKVFIGLISLDDDKIPFYLIAKVDVALEVFASGEHDIKGGPDHPEVGAQSHAPTKEAARDPGTAYCHTDPAIRCLWEASGWVVMRCDDVHLVAFGLEGHRRVHYKPLGSPNAQVGVKEHDSDHSVSLDTKKMVNMAHLCSGSIKVNTEYNNSFSFTNHVLR